MSIIDILITFSTTTQAQPQVGRDLQLFGNFQDSRQLLIFFQHFKDHFLLFCHVYQLPKGRSPATQLVYTIWGPQGQGFFSLNAYLRGKWYHVACRSWSQTLSISLKVDYSHMRHTPIYSVEFVFNLKNRILLGNKVIVSGIKTTKKSTLSSNQ